MSVNNGIHPRILRDITQLYYYFRIFSLVTKEWLNWSSNPESKRQVLLEEMPKTLAGVVPLEEKGEVGL